MFAHIVPPHRGILFVGGGDENGTSAKLIASIVETGLMAILGIACIISECNKQTRTQALQNTIDNAQQEMKRVNSTPFLLK